MQNEKLFSKIKEVALHDTSGTEDYNPEKIWAKMERKRSTNRFAGWYYAAASVIILVGIYIVKPSMNISDISAESKVKTENVTHVKNEKRSHYVSVTVPYLKAPTSDQTKQSDADLQIKKPDNQPLVFPNSEETLMPDPTLAKQNFSIVEIASATDTIPPKPNFEDKPDPEKVLIAEIEIPEKNPIPSSALTEILDQVKKGREARRMRVKFESATKKRGIWAFVHQSFYEAPHVVKPANPAKDIK